MRGPDFVRPEEAPHGLFRHGCGSFDRLAGRPTYPVFRRRSCRTMTLTMTHRQTTFSPLVRQGRNARIKWASGPTFELCKGKVFPPADKLPAGTVRNSASTYPCSRVRHCPIFRRFSASFPISPRFGVPRTAADRARWPGSIMQPMAASVRSDSRHRPNVRWLVAVEPVR